MVVREVVRYITKDLEKADFIHSTVYEDVEFAFDKYNEYCEAAYEEARIRNYPFEVREYKGNPDNQLYVVFLFTPDGVERHTVQIKKQTVVEMNFL